MNKKIKRIVAMGLVLSAVAGVSPASFNNVNFLMTEVSAASDTTYLDKISVSGAKKEDLKKGKNKTYKYHVDKSRDSVNITIYTKSSSDIVKIDGEILEPESGSSKKYKYTLDLEGGRKDSTDVTIKVTNADGEKENSYKLKVYRDGKKDKDDDDDDDDDKYDDIYLDKISLSAGKIDFSKKKKSFDIEVGEDIDEIKIKAEPEDDDYVVIIDNDEVTEDDKWRTTVDLEKGKKNVIKIEIEDDDDNKRTYTLNIYRGIKAPNSATNVSNADNTQDSIYLDDIVLNSGDISLNFNKKVTSYETSVKESVDSIIIKATADDGDDTIRLNGNKVTSGSSKRVQLEKGENKIILKVSNEQDYDTDDDDYEQRIYTIKVYRGTKASESTVTNTPTQPLQMDQWINVMGRWKYNDSTGTPLANKWFYDRNYAHYYYFDQDGFMKTGWLYNSGNWYYLDASGAMQVGWLALGSNWYYLKSDGTMATGWIKDNGKWYYLDASGKMLSNTTIGKYRLGPSGALI